MFYSILRLVFQKKNLEFFVYLHEVGDLECYNWHHNQTRCRVLQNTYQSRISNKKIERTHSQLTEQRLSFRLLHLYIL